MDDSLHAARQGDLILHPPLMAELVSSLTEAVVYAAATAAVAAAIGGAVVAVVGTGGAAAALTPLIAGALVGAAAMLPGGEDKSIGDHISDFSSWVGNSMFPPEPYGAILTGSSNTHINGQPAARAAGTRSAAAAAADTEPVEEPSTLQTIGGYAMAGAAMLLPVLGLVSEIESIFNPPLSKAADPGTEPADDDRITCSKHPPMPEQYIAQGSDKVFINGQPAARVGDKSTCDGPIGMTFSPDVRIGGSTLTVRDIHDGKSALAKVIGLVAGMLIARRSRTRPRPKNGPKPPHRPQSKPRNCKIGHPVVTSTGGKLLDGIEDFDFTLPGLVPIDWPRRYDSTDLREHGLLGKGWSLPYEVALERVPHPRGGELWIYVDEEGNRLELGHLHEGSAFVSVLDGLAFFLQAEGLMVVEDIYSGMFQVFSPDPHDPRRSRLVRLGDRNFNTLELLYDGQGRLQYIIDAFGRSAIELCFANPHERRVQQVERLYLQPGERFAVLRRERLVSYRYTPAGQLQEVLDASDRSTRSFAYTTEGWMASQRSASGAEFHYQWQRFERPARAPLTMPGEAQPSGLPALLEPQPEHEWRVVRHWGGNGEDYRFEYDLERGQTRVVDSLGRVNQYFWGEHYEVYRYVDPQGNCWEDDIRQGQLVASRDPAGNQWHYNHDGLGRLTGVRDPLGRCETISYTRHWALPLKVTDGAGRTRRFAYDSRGNLVCEWDPLNRATRYQVDARGRTEQTTDSSGKTRHLQWNEQGQLLAYRDCSGQTTRYHYDARGLLESLTNARGERTRYRHDARGYLTARERPDGRLDQYLIDDAGRLVQHVDPAGHTTAWHYDSVGLLSRRVDAMGLSVSASHDAYGRLHTLTNENGESYRFEWDALDRLVAQQNLDGSGRSYRYGALGELVGLSQHPASEAEPSMPGSAPEPTASLRQQSFEHDAVGRLVRKRSADGLTELHYDAADNLLEVLFDDGQGAPQRLAFSYDLLGQITSETSAAGTLKQAYDELGNLQTLTLADGRAINFLHYGSGHLHQINLDGRVISDFERDAVHAEVLRTQGRLLTRSEYNSSGRLARRSLQHIDASPVQLPLLSKQYCYDASDNLLSQVLTQTPHPEAGEALDSQRAKVTYDYGPTERLHGVTHVGERSERPLVEVLGYDRAGNLLDGYQVNGLVHHDRVKVFQDKRYRYDLFGRLSEKRSGSQLVQRFVYDAEDRITRIDQQRGPVQERIEFSYDPLGRRTSKTLYRADHPEPLSQTRFVWQGMRLLQEIHNGQPSLYLYSGADSYDPLARVDGAAGDEQILYFHTNPAGLPEQLTDEHGRSAWRSDYQAWGRSLNEWSAAGQTRQQNLRYQGQYLDRETGLHYNTLRYYDPDIGRFTQPDPIGLDGGLNLYRYAPNPLGWIDPWGWAPEAGDIAPYGRPAPGMERHHGILDAWSKHNIPGYVSRNRQTPIIVMTEPQHTATKQVAFNWIQGIRGKKSFRDFDWTTVSKYEITRLSNKMFEAAENLGLPKGARKQYYTELKKYLRELNSGCG